MRRTTRDALRALRLALVWLSWSVVAALVVVTAFHLSHREPWTFMVGLIAATPWVYMPAWVAASVGLFWGRRWLAAVSLALVALQLWWVVPEFDPVPHLAGPLPGAVPVRLFDANVSQANRNLSEIAAEIRRSRPEVVTMEELTPLSLASLEAAHVMGRFRYRFVLTDWGSLGMAVWSLYPLSGLKEWYAAGHPELQAWLDLPAGRRLRLDVLHTTAPYGPAGPGPWAQEMGAIRAELAHEPRPLVAVGDLNATWYDWHFQALLGLHLRDAAVVAGQGWRMTWPRDQQPVVPYLRLDHVLVSPSVAIEAYAVGYGRGSDHHPLNVELEVR